jgi:LuxR family transcriptional regulator, maltose regulon positive regulatory protein
VSASPRQAASTSAKDRPRSELLRGAAVELAEPALALLYERTERWAAGLRLAALSLAGHPEPERFAAEFPGSERTVAEYPLAEVLGRRSLEVQRLLLRTSSVSVVAGQAAMRLPITYR